MDRVRRVIPEIMTQDVDSSAKLIIDEVVWDKKIDKRVELPIIWSIVLESIVLVEEEMRQEVDLPNLVICLNNSLYQENLANSSIDTKIVFSNDDVITIW